MRDDLDEIARYVAGILAVGATAGLGGLGLFLLLIRLFGA